MRSLFAFFSTKTVLEKAFSISYEHQNISYRLDCAHKVSISEENDDNRNNEVAAEHVQDVGFIVETWGDRKSVV